MGQFDLSPCMKMSLIRENYSIECETHVNKHINIKLQHSYVYLSLCSYFHGEDHPLPGFAEFFFKYSEEEREQAVLLLEYQTKRGGQIDLRNITKHSNMNWRTIHQAVQAVLEMEKEENLSLLAAQTQAATNADFHLEQFLMEKFVNPQTVVIKTLGDLLTKINRAKTGLGIHVLDRDISLI